MNVLGDVLVAVAVLACSVIYGTDVFAAIVLRPALSHLDDRTLTTTMGNVHSYADRRLPAPGVAGLVATASGTVVMALGGHVGAAIAGGLAVGALVAWLSIYGRVSSPINRRLTAAAQDGRTLSDPRSLQQRWDSVINLRSALQMLAVGALCSALILS